MDDERTKLDEDLIVEELEFDDDDEIEESDEENDLDYDYIESDMDYDDSDNDYIEPDIDFDSFDNDYTESNIDYDDSDNDYIESDNANDNYDNHDNSNDDSNGDSNDDSDDSTANLNNKNLENDNSNLSIPDNNNSNNQSTGNSNSSEPNQNNLNNQSNSGDSNSANQKQKQPNSNSNSPETNRNNFNNAKMNNSSDKDSEMLKKCLQKGKNKNLAKNNAKNREQDEEPQKEGLKDKVQKKALEEGVSALAQAYGVPKPLADVAASEVAGPLLEKKKEIDKKKRMILSIVIGSALFIILIPILWAGNDEDYQSSESESRTNYLYGSGSDADLYSYLNEMGICDDDEDCASSDAANFYKELKNVLNSNTYLTPKHADSFIIKMILYERDEDDAYKHIDEIQYISDIIGKNEAFNIEKSDNYIDAFTQENGYFDTYRSEDLLKKNNTVNYKKELYNKIVKNAKQLVSKLENATSEEDYMGPQVCRYTVNGKTPSNIKVRLLQCADDTRGEPIPNEELVDFEKYILGVVYAENGNGSIESFKAQAIAARTYSLLRGDKMGGAHNLGLTNENGQWILSIRNCTEDQVYCDPDRGCWSNDKYAGGTVHSGYDSSKTYKKGALAATSPIRAAVEETVGKILVGADGSLINTTYTQTNQDIWNNNAKEGKDHFELLKLTYPSASRISSSCVGTTVGEYRNWKQCKQAWSSIKLGNSSSNICDAGCYVTSIAIQMAASGTKINSNAFNPGVLVKKLNSNYAFTSSGSLSSFAWNNLAPNFKFYTTVSLEGSQSEKAAKIKEYQDKGYYVIIRAKTNQHWVALDNVVGDQVYMLDPASTATKLWERYPSNDVTKITIFEKVD